MARKPKNANIDIRQTARVYNEQAFGDGCCYNINQYK